MAVCLRWSWPLSERRAERMAASGCLATLPWYALEINSVNMDALLQSRISNVRG